MSSAESPRPFPLLLKEQMPPEGKKISVAYHLNFSNYYHNLYCELISRLHFGQPTDYDGKKMPIGLTMKHTDGALFYAALEGENHFFSDAVVAPVWFAPPLDETLFSIFEMANAFKKSRRIEYGEKPFAKRFIGLFPYAELREDQNSAGYLRSYWPAPRQAREAVTAQIFADTIAGAGVTEGIFLDVHSEIAMRHFTNMETLCLTSAPIFADWLLDNKLITADNYKTAALVALDIGALQKNLHLSEVIKRKTGWEIKVALLGKKRSGHSEVGKQELLMGSLDGVQTAILFDDIVASAGSILKTAKSMVEKGVKKVIPCIAHGVLCGKYAENITGAIATGVIPKFAITNSLPQANDMDFLPIGLDVLPVEDMLAFFGREVALRSIKDVKEDPRFQDYVLTPKSKLHVGLKIGVPFETLVDAIEIDMNSSAMLDEILRLPPDLQKKLPEFLQQKLTIISQFVELSLTSQKRKLFDELGASLLSAFSMLTI